MREALKAFSSSVSDEVALPWMGEGCKLVPRLPRCVGAAATGACLYLSWIHDFGAAMARLANRTWLNVCHDLFIVGELLLGNVAKAGGSSTIRTFLPKSIVAGADEVPTFITSIESCLDRYIGYVHVHLPAGCGTHPSKPAQPEAPQTHRSPWSDDVVCGPPRSPGDDAP